jgi:acyl-CoA dehydrogenase
VAISAPAVHAGAAATLALAAGGCARVHAPFAEPAGDMAAAQEALAVVAATTESSRALAAFAALTIDRGERPLGIAAFARAIAIQQARLTAAAAADIGVFHGALRGLIRWLPLREPAGEDPARLERATQYTRAVLRSHRAFMQALSAAREPNPALALARFDDALWEHIGHGLSSGVRALLLGVLVRLPGLRLDPAQRHRRAIDRYSAALAFAADVSLSRLAVDLASPRSFTARRGVREAARLTLTTWLGDALAELLLAMAALKRYEDEGSPAARRAQLDWICAQAYRAVEEAFDKVLRHLSSPALALLLRVPIFPLGRAELAPSDETNRQVAQSLMDTGYLNAALATDDPRLRPLAQAWNATLGGEALERGAAAASNAERPASARIEQALAAGALEPAQAQQLREWLAIMRELDRPAALSAEQSSTTP